jgi:hypothetical protein
MYPSLARRVSKRLTSLRSIGLHRNTAILPFNNEAKLIPYIPRQTIMDLQHATSISL